MKKVTSANTTTPAQPAPEPVKTASTKSKKAKTATATKPLVAQAPAVTAPVVKEDVPSAADQTVIAAQIDVGFGNTLYIRGEGPGLSWEKGVPLDCVADDRWSISLFGASKPIVFKFLLNDLTWCSGDDFIVEPGATLTLTPAF